jgi:hypothetical protein
MGFIRAQFALIAMVVVSACARPAESLPARPALEPVEYGEQCAAARQLARDSAGSPAITPPRALQLLIPPLPIPMDVRRQAAVVIIRVDSAGKFAPGDLTLIGPPNRAYQDRMRRTLISGLEFYPARIGKCGVNGTAKLTFEF